MPLDVDRLADEMLRGTQALIAKAMAPVLADNAALREANDRLAKRLDAIESAPKPEPVDLSGFVTRDEAIHVSQNLSDDAVELAERIKALETMPAPEPVDWSGFVNWDEARRLMADHEATVKEFIRSEMTPPDLSGFVLASDLPAIVSAEVEKAVAAIPRPQDGKPGEKGAPGRDGIGLAGALIDRDGSLVVTLTNGEAKSLGPVVGRDGDKGEAGRDGADGVGFDDLDVVHDGERGFTFRFTKGERVVEKHFELPVVVDRGVYAAGKEYAKGDGVSYGGSFWIAQEPTSERPDGGKGWRLSVKKGRDGRDAVVKTEAAPSPLKVG